MNQKYKITAIVTGLLLILSISLSTISYLSALNNTQKLIKTQSLPLSLDNIYTDIQKNIIEPHLVSSMMANDTFIHDWLKNEENEDIKIIKYLKYIKEKYNMYSIFLVCEKTKNYYTNNGLMEKLSKDNPSNKWYYDFKEIQEIKELNIDYNKHIANDLILFINYKIVDENFSYLGTTGVALKLPYIDNLLKKFRKKYNFKVIFFNQDGDIVLVENADMRFKNIDNMSDLKPYKDTVLSKKSKSFEYTKDAQTHIVHTKYIPELNLYLSIDANLEDFMQKTKETLYINIFISLIITIMVMIIIYLSIKKYSKQIEHLSHYDTLTNIPNRRYFEEMFHRQILLNKRNKKNMALIFIDIDNFKSINDTLGHTKGDEALKIIAKILSNKVRETDLIARWGGEEFVILLIDSSLDSSLKVVEKLRLAIQEDIDLKNIVGVDVTGSFGLTMVMDNDTQDKVIARADEAMYKSKQNGKNKISVK